MNQNKLPTSPPIALQQQQQQQQPINSTSPRNVNVGNTAAVVATPLPTEPLLTQYTRTIESKATQLQQLNKDIYQLLKITTPPNNKDTLTSTDEYENNIKLLNQYRVKVFELIKELQQDMSNQALTLAHLTPILNEQQDLLFYDPPQPTTSTQTTETGGTIDSTSNMDTSTSTVVTKLTPEQHNMKLFNEKFQQHLTPKTVQDQSSDWDVVNKDKEKLAKNTDRVKFTIFSDKNR